LRRHFVEDEAWHDLFEEQVNRTPNATAVVLKEQLSYQELKTKDQTKLPDTLIKQGVRKRHWCQFVQKEEYQC